MIEHHFVVVYNKDTGHYYMCDENIAFPAGPIYDTSTGNFRFINEDEVDEDAAAYGWLSAAISKLSDETSKV